MNKRRNFTQKRRKGKKRSNKRKTSHKRNSNSRKKYGSGKEDTFYKYLKTIPIELFRDFNIDADESTDDVIEKLKMTVAPDTLESHIKDIIDAMNSVPGVQQFSDKFGCWQVREMYVILIQAFISEWEKVTSDNATNKAKGAAYLRWVMRVTVRRFTNVYSMATRNACNPTTLEQRDIQKYHCQPNEECPTEAYLIDRLGIPADDENSPKWLEMVESAKRENRNFDFGAATGKFFGV